MRDERINKVAKMLVEYSVSIQPDEIVRIMAYDFESKPLVKELIKEIYNKGGIPVAEFIDEEVASLQMQHASEKRINTLAKWEMQKTKDMDAYILIRGKSNEYEMNKVPQEIIQKNALANKEAQHIRVNERKWVLLNYPTNMFANNAKMGFDEYQDFFYDVMLVDYPKMYENAKPLKELMDKTDKVRIESDTTNLTFSIKGINSVICAGSNNVPDGEVFTAPVKDSVNGHVQYNTITSASGVEFKNVYLEVKDGKIIKATSETNNDKIESVFNTDEGARYFGEFALGLNPKINKPVGDILFDEKIYGSFHLTPGQAYEDANNGNNSAIHWDLVCIQTPEHGGGKIYFDDELVRENGDFVKNELKSLNK
ncbi:aminopeptidase [Mycoplasma sp. P36-A1]|uniref:aminopeptidase n=1 Tax=Mycoplasma sp. P36-A1 TaxID=3252900 RepID=UPI003C2ADEE4